MSQTIIIESNREISYKESIKAVGRLKIDDNGVINFPNNSWKSTIPNGIQINTGDQISIEACMINTKGSPEETIEFSGEKNPNPYGFVDNEIQLVHQFYICSRLQFNCPLPLDKGTVKFLKANAKETDFGCLDLSTFDRFKANYPYNSIEDEKVVATKPPLPLDNSNPLKLYLMNADRYDVNTTYVGWEKGNNIIGISPFTKATSFIIQEGFNTPSNVGQNLTAQYHNRLGDASNWDNQIVSPQIFNISTSDNTQFGSKEVFRAFQNPAITDESFLTVPTSTGDICYGREQGRWATKIKNEAGHTEGDNYTEAQGREALYKNLLVGNVEEYVASTVWMGTRHSPLYATQINNNNWENASIYTGNTTLNNAEGQPVGVLGQFPCINDFLDFVDLGVGQGTEYFTSSSATATVDNLRCLKILAFELLTTNLFYNENNIDRIKDCFNLLEIPTSGNITPETPRNEQYRFFNVLLEIGRSNDELSQGTAKCKILLPKPSTYNLPDNAPQGSEGIGADGLPNSYQTISGVKTLISDKNILNGKFDNRYNVRFRSRWFDDYPKLVKLPTNSKFQLKNPIGVDNNIKLSINADLAVIPVYYKPDQLPEPNLLGVPFCAFICSDNNIPVADGAIPNAFINKIPLPMVGEFFGRSPSCYDNLLSKIVTTQKVGLDTNQQADGSLTYTAGKEVTDYMPYIMIGADNPTITFDSEYGRYSISDYHTATRGGNGTYQSPLATANEQATQKTIIVNSVGRAFIGSVEADGTQAPASGVRQNFEPFPTITAQSGMAISMYRAKNANNGLFEDIEANQPQKYEGTLFSKLGFSIEQILPFTGKRQNMFNRGNYNKFLGNSQELSHKFLNMVKPFTTNAYVSGADSLGLTQNDKKQPMEDIGAINNVLPANTNAESDELVAVELPSKLDYSYLVVYSDIVKNNLYYGGANGESKIPAMAYISRNYSTGDYFYSFSTGWTYTADLPYVLTDFNVEIKLPNGSPAPINNNSSVIFKIQKPQPLPPPLSQLVPNNDPKEEKVEKK